MKNKLNNKQLIVGTMLSEIQTPNIIRMLNVANFDYIIIDNEHGYFSYDAIANMTAIANSIKLPLIVRITSPEKDIITKLLDIGVDGLLLTMTNTREDIETLINYAKYPPLGKRGISTQRAHTNYNPKSLDVCLREGNEKTMIFAQIESIEGVQNLNEIISVQSLDGIFIGPNDLSLDLNDIGNFENPEFINHCNYIVKTCIDEKIPVGIISSKPDFLKKYISKGITMVSCNSEIGMLINAAKAVVKTFKEE